MKPRSNYATCGVFAAMSCTFAVSFRLYFEPGSIFVLWYSDATTFFFIRRTNSLALLLVGHTFAVSFLSQPGQRRQSPFGLRLGTGLVPLLPDVAFTDL